MQTYCSAKSFILVGLGAGDRSRVHTTLMRLRGAWVVYLATLGLAVVWRPVHSASLRVGEELDLVLESQRARVLDIGEWAGSTPRADALVLVDVCRGADELSLTPDPAGGALDVSSFAWAGGERVSEDVYVLRLEGNVTFTAVRLLASLAGVVRVRLLLKSDARAVELFARLAQQRSLAPLLADSSALGLVVGWSSDGDAVERVLFVALHEGRLSLNTACGRELASGMTIEYNVSSNATVGEGSPLSLTWSVVSNGTRFVLFQTQEAQQHKEQQQPISSYGVVAFRASGTWQVPDSALLRVRANCTSTSVCASGDRASVRMDASVASALPVCGARVNYAAALCSSRGLVEAALASAEYERFESALARFDCSSWYSLWTCDDCRQAYGDWLCAIHFGRCEARVGGGMDGGAGAGADVSVSVGEAQICSSLCVSMASRCPAFLKLHCPSAAAGELCPWYGVAEFGG